MERFMDDDMLVEHGKDTTQMWVKYEDCVQEIALTNADAQATIAALQARVNELEEWKRIVTGAGTDQESVIRLAAHEYTKTAIQCWKEANAKLESQLTQRTAELEAVRVDSRTYINERHENMKQIEQLQAELERVKGEFVEATHNANVYQSLYSTGCMDRALLENELRDIRTLVLALPKVEGGIYEVVASYRYDKVPEAWFHCEDQLTALLKHRQGMEG